jgi:hypothetical protein
LTVVAGVGGYYGTKWKDRQEQPTLIFDKTVCDFGVIGQGESPSTEFAFTNGYPVPVHISSVAGGCSCQKAEVDKMDLEPGERAAIRVTWNVGPGGGASPISFS